MYCKSPTRVTNSRHQKQINQIWRRRICTSCSAVFTTSESVDYLKSIVIETIDKSLSPFKREKLLISILRSCEHRKDALDDAIALTNTVISKSIRSSTDGIIRTNQLAQTIFETLHNFDYASAVQYAAYHPEYALATN